MSDRVTKWLEGLGLGQYAAAFAENALDWDLLPDVDQDTLKDIGIRAAGHRLRILRAASELKDEAQAGRPPARGARRGPPPRERDHDLAAWERRPGERKPVTMLFADIVGSTALTERLDPEETHDLLYGLTERLCEAVDRHRGTVCRFMGDGVMAMFGAPLASERHAIDACEAALAMQRLTLEYARDQGTPDASTLQIRVGLHSGEVVVLTVGDGGKVEYDASGPTVPIAARMEQIAEPGAIYLTAATHALAERRIDAESRQPARVKGVAEPLAVFVLRGMRTEAEAMAAAARTPFVGRTSELRQLRSIWESCLAEGHGQTVYVRGDPGIGKTRLLGELARMATDSGGVVHRALVLPFGAGRGGDAVGALARSLLGLAPEAEEETRARAVELALRSGRLRPEQQVFLNDLLDLPQAGEQRALYDAMDQATRNAGKSTVVASLVRNASEQGPILLVVEDVHWADEVTIRHLAALCAIVSECRGVLAMTSRIEGDPLRRPGAVSGVPLATIDLGPLRQEESMALIGEFVQPVDPLAARCLERAAGNPLFLEQLLRTAREDADTELPDSIQTLVLARLDLLEVRDKRALQAASVLGQRFDLPVLRHLLQDPEYECSPLIEHNLVRPEAGGYLFGHALIQEGIYGSLLRSERRKLHMAAAEWFGGRDGVLRAQHLDRADDPGAGAAYLEAAREQKRSHRYDDALRLIERGLEIEELAPVRHRLSLAKGELLLDCGEVDASTAVYREAESRSEDELALLDARVGLAACMRVTTRYDEALELLDECESVAERHGLALHLSRLLHLRGNVYFSLGRTDGCYRAHQRALAYAQEASSLEDEVKALGGMGDAEYARGRMRRGYRVLHECIEKARQHGFGRVEVANVAQMIHCQFFLGDCETALHASLEAARAAARVSHDRAELNSVAGVANASFELGDIARLETSGRRAIELARRLRASSWEAVALSCTGLLHYLQGDRERGCEQCERALALKPALSFIGGWLFGSLALNAVDPALRTRALGEGERVLREGTMGANHLFFYRYAIDACLDDARWDRATAYAEALERFTADEPLVHSTFFTARARALAEHGRGERSEGLVQELSRLAAEAAELKLKVARRALDEALAAYRQAPPGSGRGSGG